MKKTISEYYLMSATAAALLSRNGDIFPKSMFSNFELNFFIFSVEAVVEVDLGSQNNRSS